MIRTRALFGTAECELNVIAGTALASWNIWTLVWAVAGEKCNVIVESVAADKLKTDPDLAFIGLVKAVGEVDLVFAVIDAIGVRGDLDGDAGVDLCAKTEGLLVAGTGLEDKIIGHALDLGDRPDVDIGLAEIGDDGLRMGKCHKGTKHQGALNGHEDRGKAQLRLR